MAPFQAIICLVLGVVCISMLSNCTDDVIVTDEVIVTDDMIVTDDEMLSDNETVPDDMIVVVEPSAISNIFKQIGDYTMVVKSPGGMRDKRNAIRGSENYWTGGIVPYRISSTFSESERRVILQSMKHWEDCTCIRFRPWTNSDIYSVMFMPGAGCRSFIGRLQRSFQPQGITLGVGCIVFPVIVHEIGHALGFFHEHSREDRDNYIQVIASNILPGFESAFDRVTSDEATTLNLGYDYASIMHYSATTFSRRGTFALVVSDPSIHFGDAQELSPFDAAKTNRLYNCNARPLPPPSTIVPDLSIVRIPNGISCGSVTKVTGSGRITSPQYPTQLLNEECAFVFEANEGYGISISFPQLSLDPTTGCTEDYVQIYRGASVSTSDLVRYGGYIDGRICNREDSRLIFYITNRIVTVYYRTNGRNRRSDVTGLRIAYDQRDIDECAIRRPNRCHSCRNLPGSYECNCRDGYYHSPAANTCFDVNECAIGNGGCAHTCTNFGGSYRCTCNNGFFLQANGLSCGRTRPSSQPQNPTPGTIIPKRPSVVTTAPPPPTCGGPLTGSSGTFNSPNWPLTYPISFNCVWNIILSNTNAIIEISFDADFGLGGKMPGCPKDQLILFDGGSIQSKQLGLFCHLTKPNPIRTTSNRLTVMFVASLSHGSTRHGFRAQYKSIIVSTPSPPPPSCGRILTGSSGVFNSPNWPSTYPLNFNCVWNIILSNTNAIIEINFDVDFGLGGKMPYCPKDQLILFDGSIRSEQLGLFCHLTKPDPIRTTSNRLTVMFVASSSHGPTRHGFRARYRSITVAPPTTASPPSTTVAPTLQLQQCGGGLRKLTSMSDGSLHTLNWPNSPYAININCDWDIECPVGATIAIKFEDSFRVAGRMPDCTKDKLEISGCRKNYGPYCQLIAPEPFSILCNAIHVRFQAGSGRGDTRTGFKLNYVCNILTPTLSPQCGGGEKSLTGGGSIQTLNWPIEPYPISTECAWDINCPSRIEINFENNFKVAGIMPACSKDQLEISGCGNKYTFCHTTPPDTLTITCSKVNVLFRSGSGRGITRIGFKLNYICLQ